MSAFNLPTNVRALNKKKRNKKKTEKKNFETLFFEFDFGQIEAQDRERVQNAVKLSLPVR